MAKQSFQLHYNYCVKNIQKCPFCNLPIAKNEMDEHMEEMKGSDRSVREAADSGDFNLLEKMRQHGADLLELKDGADRDNTLLHYAAKNNNLQLVKFLKSIDADFDVRNANGETALHLCCGQQVNPDLAKFLVMCGASTQAKNALGDTPLTLASRFGHTELAMLLNTSSDQSQVQAEQAAMRQTANMFGSTVMTSASSNKPPTAYQPYHPAANQAQHLEGMGSP